MNRFLHRSISLNFLLLACCYSRHDAPEGVSVECPAARMLLPGGNLWGGARLLVLTPVMRQLLLSTLATERASIRALGPEYPY